MAGSLAKILIAASGGLLSMGAVAVAEDIDLTKAGNDFTQHCAICHGVGATGNGPLAQELVKPPANLTTLTARNSGTFPEDRVRETIEFGGGIGAHGSSNMLAWGPFFTKESGAKDAAARIQALARYIKSLQKE